MYIPLPLHVEQKQFLVKFKVFILLSYHTQKRKLAQTTVFFVYSSNAS